MRYDIGRNSIWYVKPSPEHSSGGENHIYDIPSTAKAPKKQHQYNIPDAANQSSESLTCVAGKARGRVAGVV